jgi:hypothetical protein
MPPTASGPAPNTFPHGLEPATQHSARRLREVLNNGDLIVRSNQTPPCEIHKSPTKSVADCTRYSTTNSEPGIWILNSKVYDDISARVALQAGFTTLYMRVCQQLRQCWDSQISRSPHRMISFRFGICGFHNVNTVLNITILFSQNAAMIAGLSPETLVICEAGAGCVS